MRISRNLGLVLLAIWLIMTGLAAFINLGDFKTLLNGLAIVTGVLLLLSR